WRTRACPARARDNVSNNEIRARPFSFARKLSTVAPIARSDPVAGMFMSIFKRELGDTGFVELAQYFRDQALVLLLRRACERQIETELTRKFERDAAVFGRVRGGKEAAVVAVLHIFAIGFQDARRRAGLRKDFTERFQIKSKRVAQRESFGKAGGVDVHHH